MKRQAYLHWGFCPADYSVPYTVYPRETVAPAYGFGVYETVWTFPTPDNTRDYETSWTLHTTDNTCDYERFLKDIKALPKNCLLYINHESGKYAHSNTGDIRTANPEYLAEHAQLMQLVRRYRPDIVFGDFNFAPYMGYLPDDRYLGYIRQANAVRYEVGNGQSFLLPHAYQRSDYSLDQELWSFGQCLEAAREQWPLMPIIPAICLQYNHRVCEIVWPRMAKEGFNFRWTAEELEKCRLPKQRLYALLQLFAALGIDRVLIWSAGMVPVDAVQENLDLVKEWCKS